jgi:hypothetical protein
MAWIELHQSIRDHRKIVDLADHLNIPEQYAVGLCIYLWTWALDNAPEGVLRMSARVVAKASGWSGNENDFLQSLIDTNWLEITPENDLYIHDWEQYAGRLIEKRKEDAARKREYRAEKAQSTKRPKNVRKTSKGHPKDIQGTSSVTVPNLTVPNLINATTIANAHEDPADDKVPALDEVPTLDEKDYYRIELLAVTLLQRPIITPDEYKMLQKLYASGVSVETIMRGIQESFDNYKPRTVRDKISRLTYCENHILDLHEKLTFVPTTNSKKGSATHGISRTSTPPDDDWAKAEANFFRRS